MNAPVTAEEFADSRERHARWSAIATLVFCSTWSIAGCVYYAAAYGAGDAPAMLITATLSLVLLLGIHLRASTHAAVEEGRAVPSARAATTVGGVLLVGMALVGNYSVLHALATAKALNPVAAVLTPLALDVGVITATWTLFALRPKLVRSRRSAGPAAPPAPPRTASLAAPAASAAPPRAASPAAPASPDTAAMIVLPDVSDAATDASPQLKQVRHPPDAESSVAPEVTPMHHERAADLVRRGIVSKPVADVALVLAHLDGGASARSIQRLTGLDPRTVGKIRDAATAPARTLTVV